MSVLEYCNEIFALLKRVDEPNWCKVFEHFIKELNNADLKVTYKNIQNIYGGMDSFNDLVLQKNGNLYFDENESLEKLKNGLYEELVKIRLSE